MTSEEFPIEVLADYAHKSWSRWMNYLFSNCISLESGSKVIPKTIIDRWGRQMNTPYANLPESEKESDRDEARKILGILIKEGWV